MDGLTKTEEWHRRPFDVYTQGTCRSRASQSTASDNYGKNDARTPEREMMCPSTFSCTRHSTWTSLTRQQPDLNLVVQKFNVRQSDLNLVVQQFVAAVHFSAVPPLAPTEIGPECTHQQTRTQSYY